MEAHVEHRHHHPHRANRQAARLSVSTLVPVGAIAGLAGGMMMAMWQMIVGAIAKDPTAVAGVHTSFWTPVEGIWSVIFGAGHFHGDFHLVPAVGGMMGHMMNSMMLGILGVYLATTLLGTRPSVARAMAFGMMFGLVLELVVVNLIINGFQSVETLYTSTPEWSWWVGHAMFGATVGLVGQAFCAGPGAERPGASHMRHMRRGCVPTAPPRRGNY